MHRVAKAITSVKVGLHRTLNRRALLNEIFLFRRRYLESLSTIFFHVICGLPPTFNTLHLVATPAIFIWGYSPASLLVESRGKVPVGDLGDQVCKHYLEILTAEMIKI